MGLQQLYFSGRNKIEEAIERIREYEPEDDYYLAFSGGKDSVVIYNLALMAGVQFEAHYHIAPTDPPELQNFMRSLYPDVIRSKSGYNFWKLIVKKGIPLRNKRWCCEYIKEWGGSGRVVITGVRAAESPRRKKRHIVNEGYKTRFGPAPKLIINPIIDWSKDEVWQFLKENHLEYCSLYDEGASGKYKGDGLWQRLGCILCPMESKEKTQLEMARWPKLADHWRRAIIKRYEAKKDNYSSTWSSGEEMFEWWINRGS